MNRVVNGKQQTDILYIYRCTHTHTDRERERETFISIQYIHPIQNIKHNTNSRPQHAKRDWTDYRTDTPLVYKTRTVCDCLYGYVYDNAKRVNANKIDNLNKEICFCKYRNNYSIESDNMHKCVCVRARAIKGVSAWRTGTFIWSKRKCIVGVFMCIAYVYDAHCSRFCEFDEHLLLFKH